MGVACPRGPLAVGDRILIARLRREIKPDQRLDFVFGHATPFEISQTQWKLRVRTALVHRAQHDPARPQRGRVATQSAKVPERPPSKTSPCERVDYWHS